MHFVKHKINKSRLKRFTMETIIVQKIKQKAPSYPNGVLSIRYLGPKIWKLVPDELKELTSIELFKKKVKCLKFEHCPCNLCKDYIYGVGYID